MFDKKLVMHNNGCNIYGLYDKNGYPLSTENTIKLFEMIQITDVELLDLNDYIEEGDGYHSYYDNFFNEYNEQGYECNFIDGRRQFYAKFDENYQPNKNYNYTCEYDGEEFVVKINDFNIHKGYVEFTVITENRKIRILAGNTGNERWACFPWQNKGCLLEAPANVEINSNKIGYVFENRIIGVTIAEAIKFLGNHIQYSHIIKSN